MTQKNSNTNSGSFNIIDTLTQTQRAISHKFPIIQKKLQQKQLQLQNIENQLKNTKIDYSSDNYVKLIKQQAKLSEWLEKYKKLNSLIKDFEESAEILQNPKSEKDMIELAHNIIKENSPTIIQLSNILVTDRKTFDNFVLEIRAGAGGEEAALFARDLFRMYTLFFESKQISYEIIDISQTEINGYKHISAYIKGENAYEWVRYESGVHRVQRVPVTESGGRIHTSTASVAILPDIDTEDIDIKIDPKDLEIQRIRASGPGGQFVNKVETAIRIKHIPTGIIVVSQQSKSQTANKEYAMKILRSKLYQLELDSRRSQLSQARKSQIGNQDRSEKIRTYNYQQNRVTDHRIKKSWYNLDQIMQGKIQDLLETVKEELDAKLLEQEQTTND